MRASCFCVFLKKKNSENWVLKISSILKTSPTGSCEGHFSLFLWTNIRLILHKNHKLWGKDMEILTKERKRERNKDRLIKQTHKERRKKQVQATVFKHFKQQIERQRQIPEMIERMRSKGRGWRCKVQLWPLSIKTSCEQGAPRTNN